MINFVYKKIFFSKKALILNALIFISISGVLLAWSLSRVSFLVLVLLSFFYLFKSKNFKFSFLEKTIFLSTVLFVLSGLLSAFYNGDYYGYPVVFENYLFLVAIIPVAVMLRSVQINAKVTYFAFVLLTLSSSVYLLFYAYHEVPMRSKGLPLIDLNSLIFTMIFITGIAIVLQKSLDLKSKLNWALFFLGLLAVYFTESRGSWLTLLITIILMATFYKNKLKIKLLFLLILALVTMVLLQTKAVNNRVEAAIDNISQYNQGLKVSSIGRRLELYKMALSFYKESPVVGIGPRRLSDPKFVEQQVKKGHFKATFFQHWHFHNQYMDALATKGSLGILTLTFLLGALLLYFIVNRKYSFYATSGIIIITMYLLSGLTEVTFEHKRMTLYFSLLMAVFIALIEKEKEHE